MRGDANPLRVSREISFGCLQGGPWNVNVE